MKSTMPTTGIAVKPNACKTLCPYYSVGMGYVTDYLGDNAKVLFMISNPSSDDVVNRQFLSGKAGYRFLKDYIYPLEYGPSDFGVCSVMRCRPSNGSFPLGVDGKGAIQACRYYDKEIMLQFQPNCFLISQSLKDTYKEPAFHSLLARDIEKAFSFSLKGLRPVVLMGNEAAALMAPYIKGGGGTKKWRSHWEEFEQWPHLSTQSLQPLVNINPFRGTVRRQR